MVVGEKAMHIADVSSRRVKHPLCMRKTLGKQYMLLTSSLQKVFKRHQKGTSCTCWKKANTQRPKTVDACLSYEKSKKLLSPPRKSKNINLTIDLLSLGTQCICSGTPSFDLPTPSYAGSSNLKSVPGSGSGTESLKVPVFWDREAITHRSAVLDQN